MELVCATINLENTYSDSRIKKSNIKMELLLELINNSDVCFLQNISSEMLNSLLKFGDTILIHTSKSTCLLLRKDRFEDVKVFPKHMVKQDGILCEIQNMKVAHLEIIYLTATDNQTHKTFLFVSTCYLGKTRAGEPNLSLYKIVVDHFNDLLNTGQLAEYLIIAGGFNVSSDELSLDKLHTISHSDFLKGIHLHLTDYFLVNIPRHNLTIEPYIFNSELLQKLNIFNKWELSRYICTNPSLLTLTYHNDD